MILNVSSNYSVILKSYFLQLSITICCNVMIIIMVMIMVMMMMMTMRRRRNLSRVSLAALTPIALNRRRIILRRGRSRVWIGGGQGGKRKCTATNRPNSHRRGQRGTVSPGGGRMECLQISGYLGVSVNRSNLLADGVEGGTVLSGDC